jgi:SAM-dependent methyltransferase
MEDFFVNMDYWYQRNPGLFLLEQEKELLRALLSQKTGDVLLQCGGPSDLQLVSDSPIANKFYCGFEVLRGYEVDDVVVADIDELPFLPGSVDVTVIAHLLSFVRQPQALLQQLYQALTPDGQLYVLGFNACSLWGLSKLTRASDGYPWCGRFYSAMKVAAWLRRLGFHVVVRQTACFRPPVNDARLWQRLLFLEALGQMCFPYFGGVYVLLAQKKEPTMTPLRSWQRRYASKSTYPEVAMMKPPPRG